MMIRTLIVDDERLARVRLERLLKADSEVVIVGSYGDASEALHAVREVKPDLIFLDVQMPGLNGFAFIASLPPSDRPAIIFVTAYDEYALRAFEVHALDYLLKPFDDERFAKALQRAKDQLKSQRVELLDDRINSLLLALQPSPKPVERILIKSGEKEFFLKANDIDWLEAAGKYVRVHSGRAEYLLRDSLNDFESKLDAARFVRIHRATIVNIERVKEMHPMFHGDSEVILEDGTRLNFSRRYRSRLKALAETRTFR
jgi:two-component system LytT family response regulator